MKKIVFLVLSLTLLLALCACGHKCDFDTEWTADGTHHWHVCSECSELADKAEHTGGTATETAKAKCDVCGTEYGEFKAHEHAFGEWTTKTPADCNNAEVEERKCANCPETETRTGDAALGHSYTQEVVDDEKYFASANCEEKATYYKSCVCGEMGTETFEVGEVIAHAFGEWATKTPADCNNAEIEARKCANCPKEETQTGDAALTHNMVAAKDDTHHWTECDREGCDEATEKVTHTAASIVADYNKTSAMEHDVVAAEDITVTATCSCGKEYVVTEGITLENNTLTIGTNHVTVKLGELSAIVTIQAEKFNKVIDGTLLQDTYVNSGSNGSNYNTVNGGSLQNPKPTVTELPIYATGTYRVFFKFNFSNALEDANYANYKDEAKVQFSFTVTTTTTIDWNKLPLIFKAYETSELRSNVDFADITWANYANDYTLGWGKEGDPNNTVSLIAKETIENLNGKAKYENGKLIITVTLREIEGCIDENGNAIFVLLTDMKDVKPKIASMEHSNPEYRPTAKVILNDEHQHAYINEVVNENYFASANCTEKAKYYYSCSCNEKGTVTFDVGEVIEHSYGDWVQTTAPTCTTEGVNTKTCGKCGGTETEAISVIPHSYNAVVTAPTCTEDGYTTYTCGCGDTYTGNEVPANGHSYGDWITDESYHWKACGCGDIDEKATHSGGTATETEQATCEACGVKYGGLASHVHSHTGVVTAPTCTEVGYTTYTCGCGDVYVGDEVPATGHSYGNWESVTPATCEVDEVTIRYCSCGASETGTGTAAFGHDMQTKYDENNHWTECAHNCGTSTEAVAHSGGEATIFERAICSTCDQPYGDVANILIDDTFVDSAKVSAENDKVTSIRGYTQASSWRRIYFRLNLIDIINNNDFAVYDDTAKLQFTFTITDNSAAVTSDTKFTLFAFDVNDNDTLNVDFKNLNWNTVKTAGKGGTYTEIAFNNVSNDGKIINGLTTSNDSISYDETKKTVTITISYSAVKNMIDPTTGYLFIGFTTNISFYMHSLEATEVANRPKVEYLYK